MAAKFDPAREVRPDDSLLKLYFIYALLTGPGFPFVILPLYFRFRTLRYRFDDEGVSMSVGLLFKREVYVAYRRIQDIHVTRGLLQRWLGLASVAVQTASGNAAAEIMVEGVPDADGVRDFLYSRMRGAKGAPAPGAPAADGAAESPDDEALRLLREIAASLESLAVRKGP